MWGSKNAGTEVENLNTTRCAISILEVFVRRRKGKSITINYLQSMFFQLLFNSQKILPFIFDADAAARQVLGGWLQLHILLLCTASQCQIKGKPGKCQPSFDAFLPFSSYFPFPFSALVGVPKLHRTALDYPQSGSIQFLQWMSKGTHSAQ